MKLDDKITVTGNDGEEVELTVGEAIQSNFNAMWERLQLLEDIFAMSMGFITNEINSKELDEIMDEVMAQWDGELKGERDALSRFDLLGDDPRELGFKKTDRSIH